jgi:DNA-binding CsgD family transcriptional regulator
MYRPGQDIQQFGEHSGLSLGPLLGKLTTPEVDSSAGQPEPASSALTLSLMQALNGIAQGVALFTDDSRLRYANATAQIILAECAWLQEGSRLNSKQEGEHNLWLKALRKATEKQTRSLLELTLKVGSIFVATVPIEVHGESLVLASFGSQSSSRAITLQLFANHHRLTYAEIEVLQKLAQGTKPIRIADQQQVALSTINTHLSSIRLKTRCASVNELLVKLSHLPPLRVATMPGASLLWLSERQTI